MDEEQRDAIQELLVTMLYQLRVIPLDAMEELYRSSTNRSNLSMFHTLAPMIDPTYYRNVLSDGTLESAELQADMLKHFIEIRKLIDKHNELAKKHGKGNADESGICPRRKARQMELPNTVSLMILGQLMRDYIQNHREQSAIMEISYWGAHGRGGAIITVTRASTGEIELMCPINDRFSSERKHRALSALQTWCDLKQLDPVADEKNLERWKRLCRDAMFL